MGMYTEIFVRATLIGELPTEVETALECIVGLRTSDGEVLPEHPLFACPRWDMLGGSGSYYFPAGAESTLTRDDLRRGKSLVIHGNIKNYDDEIELFFDWVNPYLDEADWDFIGFELYEEDTQPTLYHKRPQVQEASNHG